MSYYNYFSKKEKKRVFLSFASEDLDHVRGLRLLKDNPDFDLDFYDESIREPVDSRNADYIKRVIGEKISRASITVCLISEITHQSKWVDWELEKSDEEGKTIIAMAIKGVERAILPRLIKDKKLTFWSWDPEHLAKLINEA